MPEIARDRRTAAMLMKGNKEVKIPYWAAHLTTIISVTLVLMIVGVIALISISAHTESRRLREQVELNAVMSDSSNNADAQKVLKFVASQPYALKAKLISKEAALKNWTAETGENLEELFGVNPLTPEVSFTVKSDYASEAGVTKICRQLAALPGVEGVAAPDTGMLTAMNHNIEQLSWILGGVALALVIISLVLINNTVHLSVYSRRFTIHTMQLVGATGGFIRRPFVLNNLLSGVIAGVLASGLLAASLAAASRAGIEDLADLIPWGLAIAVFACLIVVGALICALAAMVSTTRYLRKDYDDLFK